MSKYNLVLGLIFLCNAMVYAQAKIHSHNDYTHEKPFYDAISHNAYSIEADIFLIGDSLFVAHNRKEIKKGNTLENLYLKPIDTFSRSKNFYSFQLMIDIKDDWNLTFPVLVKQLNKYKRAFSRGKQSVSTAISGDRPPDSTFHLFPKIITFDGLPGHLYQKEDLEKVAMISDNFKIYSKWKGLGEIPLADKESLLKAINEAHKNGKLCRFWNVPDNENAWRRLHKLGADIINTDKVAEATNYFKTH